MIDPSPISFGDLRHHALPSLAEVDDKDGRGQVFVVAGGRLVPGAAVLTGLAALRAGAGKLQVAAPASHVTAIGLALPEAAVISTPDDDGEFTSDAWSALAPPTDAADAVVIGPGMAERTSAGLLAQRMLGQATPCVLDAAALTGLAACESVPAPRGARVMTPHAGEMAKLSAREKDEVVAKPVTAALETAIRFGAVVALKGPTTFVVTPQGEAFRHDGGCVGLATSGSGDVLAGLIGGFLARGADPLTATLWGVCVHAEAGRRLSAQIGPVGFLARELLGVVPSLLGPI
jgi:ADP-dependent NAD(P)H-hydrate dehydratase